LRWGVSQPTPPLWPIPRSQNFGMNGMANIAARPGGVMHGVAHRVKPEVGVGRGAAAPRGAVGAAGPAKGGVLARAGVSHARRDTLPPAPCSLPPPQNPACRPRPAARCSRCLRGSKASTTAPPSCAAPTTRLCRPSPRPRSSCRPSASPTTSATSGSRAWGCRRRGAGPRAEGPLARGGCGCSPRSIRV
jgi:hypothetical protein